MKKIPTIRLLLLALALSGVNAAATFRPDWIPGDLLPMVNLAIAMFFAVEILWLVRPRKTDEPNTSVSPKAPAASPEERTRHELARFLGLFQEKGRLVDFLMEDIQSQPDERVGQVARVVHQGCKEVIDDYFALESIRTEPEGGTISITEGFDPASLRLVGSVAAEGDIQGTLLHKGWQTKEITLPRLNQDVPESSPFYLVAPAELEVR